MINKEEAMEYKKWREKVEPGVLPKSFTDFSDELLSGLLCIFNKTVCWMKLVEILSVVAMNISSITL